MSEEQAKEAQPGVRATNPDWRQRMLQIGKAEFIREEMERLGFWPPTEGVAAEAQEAEAQLAALTPELRALRQEMAGLDAEIRKAGDIPALLQQIRKRRIERVRAAREAKRQQRAAQRETHRQQDRERRQKTLPYLGHGVSGGLRYEGGDDARLEALGLPVLHTAEELAAAIGIPVGRLAWLTYHRGASAVDHYARFAIPKRAEARALSPRPNANCEWRRAGC
jgi:RNA-directed DNA polymerase